MKKTLLITFLLAFTAFSFAQKTPAVKDTIAKDTTKTKTAEKPEKTPEEKRAEAYDKLLKKKGLERNGLFTVRKIEDKWYFEVPDSLLNRYFLCVTRLKAAPQNFGLYAGEKVNEQTVYFEQRDEKTLLLRSFLNLQEANDESNIAVAVANSSANPVVASFTVIGRNPKNKNQLIDITDFFKGDNTITSLPAKMKTDKKIGGVANDRSFVEDIRPYLINVEVNSLKTYNASPSTIPSANRTGAVSLELNVSMVLLPKEPMQKRLFDPRVGYFASKFIKFNDKQQRTETEYYIHRFRLEPRKEDVKKYLSGQLVRPKKQIVFYIDPATPKQWQKYLILGVNDWNVAFEQAGFKDAIVAKPWPNDPSMSLEDARFNVIRYLPSEISNAYGPNIADPRSGEIIESHIGWYHSVMKLLQQWYMIQVAAVDKRARSMELSEELMGDLIRFVSSHEVGHTLGLRHNMGASSQTPVEKLRDKKWVEANGHTVSIMDYARFNYVAQPEDNIGIKGLYPRIGIYDKWAIEWGYRYYGNKYKDEYAEQNALANLVTQRLKAEPRLWFGGEGRGEDPRAQTEDLSDNVMKANTYALKNLRYIVQHLPEWTKQDNDKYEHLNEMQTAAYQQYFRYLRHVLKYIGNRYVGIVGDKEVYKEVPKERVKEAIAYIDRELFEAPLWLYPQAIVEKTGATPDKNILSMQSLTLSILLGDAILYTLYNQSLSSSNPYPLNEYLADVFKAVWKPLNSTDERQNTYRRGAERLYLSQLDKLINEPESKDGKATVGASIQKVSDVRLFALQHLNTIEAFAKDALAKESSSSINHLHYQEILKEIERIRNPKK
ncbi:glutaminyl-tRNA synthetase [Capnocytophaga sp. HP1101]